MNQQEVLIQDEIARISFLANKCLSHAQQAMEAEALLAARKATEGMLYYVAHQKKYISDTKFRTIQNYIDIFKGKQDSIPLRVLNHVETIREYANPDLHFQVNDIKYEPTTMQNCLNALSSIMTWYVSQFPESAAQCLFDVSQSLLNSVPYVKLLEEQPDAVDTYHNESNEEISRLRKKAEQKNIHAIMYLAKLHKQGYAGIFRDLNEALRLYTVCMNVATDDTERAMALDEMSKICYSRHQYENSFCYALESAELGNARIMVHLAFLYSEGIGVSPNKKAAEKWFIKATESNCPLTSVAYYDLAKLYMYSASDRPIRQTLLQAAAQHHVASCYRIGKAYALGVYDFPKDFNEAKGWLELAADEGNSDAMYELGRLYYLGDSTFPPDFSVAQQWFERGMQLKHVGSTYHLGYLHEFGFFGDADYGKAKVYYKEAAEQGHLYSQYNYGFLCLMETQKVKPEYKQAKEYLERAAQQDFAMAYCALGEMEYLGLGQTPRKSRARILFNEARNRGDVWPDIILDALS